MLSEDSDLEELAADWAEAQRLAREELSCIDPANVQMAYKASAGSPRGAERVGDKPGSGSGEEGPSNDASASGSKGVAAAGRAPASSIDFSFNHDGLDVAPSTGGKGV